MTATHLGNAQPGISNPHPALEISSSSDSDSEPGVGQTPRQTRMTEKRATTATPRLANNGLSAMTSAPCTPCHPNAGPSSSKPTEISATVTPNPKTKRKGRPTVTKLVAIPTRVIELSDASDGEMGEFRHDLKGKCKGRSIDSEDEGYFETSLHLRPPHSAPIPHSGWNKFYASDDEDAARADPRSLKGLHLDPTSPSSRSPSGDKPSVPPSPSAFDPSSPSLRSMSPIPVSVAQGELDLVQLEGRSADSLVEPRAALPHPFPVASGGGFASLTRSNALCLKDRKRASFSQTSILPSLYSASHHRLSLPPPSSAPPTGVSGRAHLAPLTHANADGTMDVDAWMYEIEGKAFHDDGDYEGGWVHGGPSVTLKDVVGDDPVRDDTGDGAWHYNLDDLDAEQLQALAVAEEADAEWMPGGRREQDSRERGEAGNVDEEMARAIALVEEWEAQKIGGAREPGSDLDEVHEAKAYSQLNRNGGPWNTADVDGDPVPPGGYPERPRAVSQFLEHVDARQLPVPDTYNLGHVLEVSSGSEAGENAPSVPEILPDGYYSTLGTNVGQPFAIEAEPDVSEDPVGIAFAAVYEVLPDIDPDHLLALLETYLPVYGPSQIVQLLVAEFFGENEGDVEANEWRVDRRSGSASGKRRADEESPDVPDVLDASAGKKEAWMEYASPNRPNDGGEHYRTCAMEALQQAFPFIPPPYIWNKFAGNNELYAPTYLEILEEEEKIERAGGVGRPYVCNTAGYVAKGKGKVVVDGVFEDERRWLEAFLVNRVQSMANPTASGSGITAPNSASKAGGTEEEDEDDEELEDDGTFVECGCCFSAYPFERMTACPDAHLFCRSCLRRFASTELGSQNCILRCMHTSGCTSLFPEHELRRLLPSGLFSLYQRLNQQKNLKDAGIDDLEECPFCDWACIIEISTEDDSLFRCENEDECGIVSCRLCKKENHMPKSCREVGEDKHLDGRVAIEEAMTRALVRACPKCKKEFIKSEGCNKVTCPNCKAISCYVCKKEIRDYSHFSRKDSGTNAASSSKRKCPLYDAVDDRHEREVKEAYRQALAEYKRDHPDFVFGKDLKVDLPKLPREALERAIVEAEAQARTARETLASAFAQHLDALAVEDSLKAQALGADGEPRRGNGVKKVGLLSRFRTRATQARKLVSAKTARVEADRKLHVAEEAVERAEQLLADLRQQLE